MYRLQNFTLMCLIAITAAAEGRNWEMRQKMNAQSPRHYLCYKTNETITIDGKMNDPAWEKAAWTQKFVDIEGLDKPAPTYPTQAKMLWDDEYFYIAAKLTEPHVWGTITERDAVIFQDNDFEIFIDPDWDTHNYYEIEINVLNTVWDLFLHKAYRDGGPADNGWFINGLLTAVYVDGTLNAFHDEDNYWSVEFAIPWSGFTYRGHEPGVPEIGQQWRVNFSRVEWQHQIKNQTYQKVPGTHENNWIWSPQGIVDMHRPEKWAFVQFAGYEAGSAEYKENPTLPVRKLLFDIYYKQRDYRAEHNEWAASLKELELSPLNINGHEINPIFLVYQKMYFAWIDFKTEDGTLIKLTIHQDGKITEQKY